MERCSPHYNPPIGTAGQSSACQVSTVCMNHRRAWSAAPWVVFSKRIVASNCNFKKVKRSSQGMMGRDITIYTWINSSRNRILYFKKYDIYGMSEPTTWAELFSNNMNKNRFTHMSEDVWTFVFFFSNLAFVPHWCITHESAHMSVLVCGLHDKTTHMSERCEIMWNPKFCGADLPV